MLDYNHLSFRSTFGGLLGMLLGLNVIVFFSAWYFSTNHNLEIDVAGRNRMLSQKIALYLNLYYSGDYSVRPIIEEAYQWHEAALEALQHGGELSTSKYEGELKSSNSETVKQALRNAKAEYVAFYYVGNIILDTKASVAQKEQAIQYINLHAPILLELNEAVVRAITSHDQLERGKMQLFVYGNLALMLMVCLLLLIYLFRHVFQFMDKMKHGLRRITLGDYDYRLEEGGGKELEELSRHINVLVRLLVPDQGSDMEEEQKQFKKALAKKSIKEELIQALNATRLDLLKRRDRENAMKWEVEGYRQFSGVLANYCFNRMGFLKETAVFLSKYLGLVQFSVFESECEKNLNLLINLKFGKESAFDFSAFSDIYLEVIQENKFLSFSQFPEEMRPAFPWLKQEERISLLLLPLEFNGRVIGMLQILSLAQLPPFKMAFINKLSATLAHALYVSEEKGWV
ncbi:hypothetical protein [Persicobacter diffluens]|uniref:HAMP domain-containing protein n=1 Tax=Persicobacter diffluens TaxID=981 RepID=A0AAN5AJ93_9BACT|nr:hypothetical protein PEDI_12810 [Persicobacter diffluens]